MTLRGRRHVNFHDERDNLQRSRLLLAASSKHARKPLLDPSPGRCWCGDQERPHGVDSDQLQRL